jgi:amino acid adenylation domain-containing protein
MTCTAPTSFLQLFERQVDRAPAAIALSHAGRRLSYTELEAAANRLAQALADAGLGPDQLVGIAVERSLDMVVALLAVLKTGAAYVPLDPSYPTARLAFMLEDTRAPLVLATSATAAVLEAAAPTIWCLDTKAAVIAAQSANRPRSAARAEHLAYVTYTSGSTGTPKGVAMPRGPLDNLITWQLENSALGASDRTLQFAPLSFDVHFQEIFATLCSGGELVLVDEALRLDAIRLLKLLDAQRIARLFLPFIALQTLVDVADAQASPPHALREVVTAGEQLVITKSLVRFFEHLPNCRLYNQYGPSETHVVTAHVLEGAPSNWPSLPPIGKTIDNVSACVLDEDMRPVPAGSEGELYLGGACLARGYLHRPELTQTKFVPDPFAGGPQRLYRTGDLARVDAEGNLQFLGRLDSQVKVRGYRIELGEVEAALTAHPAVQQAAVVAREDDPGDKRLVAYVVCGTAPANLDTELRRHLSEHLPEYMLPSAFVALTALPRTPSGKIDRRNLPQPEGRRPELEASYQAPRTDLEDALCKLWARLIKIDRVGIADNFFELGGNSLLALRMVVRLRQERGLELPITQVFAHPTVSALAAWLGGEAGSDRLGAHTARPRHRESDDAVAIVGMAGRFPGARDLDEFWELLADGRDATTCMSDAELDPLVDQALRRDPTYVRRRGVLDGAERFDAAFFGINPAEAAIIDPQQRVLLETAWQALEHAGYAPESVSGSVGVFAGTHNNSYFLTHVLPRPDAIARVGSFAAMVGSEKDYVATRIAHKLDLTGPALSIHTACSTSLVAVCVAVRSLLARDCDLALAGAASVTVPQKSGHLYQEGGMLSDDGFTRTFDADARGTTFSDGVGAVVLKRLSDAVADGDTIHALIRGVGLNNDGANKASFTAPSVEGQALAILRAQELAGVEAHAISYVEAHGTATPLGDPVEVEALTRVFRRQTAARGFCGIGSIKSNFGHLTAAAGVAGLIKTVLALQHELLPPTLHFRAANPLIDFAASPFYVVAAPTPWPKTSAPRRAGVSSFGVGGTNAHVVVEEAPAPTDAAPSRGPQLLLLSARSDAALERVSENLKEHLQRHADLALADVAFTLHAGRRAFRHRRYLVAADVQSAVELLDRPSLRRSGRRASEQRNPPVVFMFPGQGAQYVGMGRALYDAEPLFRVIVDQCAEELLPELGRDLRQVLFPADADAQLAEATLDRTEFAQPALFTIEYALASLWMSWGVRPALTLGHSVGEYVCAVLASVMQLEDALRLVALRGKLLQALPAGTMLSVRLPASKLEGRLVGQLAIAADNGPNLSVVSGPNAQIEDLRQALEAEGVACKPLSTSHAFHSPMVEPAVQPLAEALQKVQLSPPKVPFISCVSGLPIRAEQATDPLYWARHLREPVRFAGAVREVWQDPTRILLEVGPGTALATLARQQMADRTRQVATSSFDAAGGDEMAALLAAAGQIWLSGIDLDGRAFFGHARRRRVPLPTYPFERERCWLDPPAPRGGLPAVQPQANDEEHARPHDEEAMAMAAPLSNPAAARKNALIEHLRAVLEDTSGLDVSSAHPATTFLELGLDSLLLTQVALSLKRRFGVQVAFRQLMEELATLDLLADHMLPRLSPEAEALLPAVAAPPPDSDPSRALALETSLQTVAGALPGAARGAADLREVIAQQLCLMQQQLALLSGAPLAAPKAVSPGHAAVPSPAKSEPLAPVEAAAGASTGAARPGAAAGSPYLEDDEPTRPATYDVKKAFGAIARIHTASEALSAKQQAALALFIGRYNQRTKGSKEWTQTQRAELADPRVVTGFRPALKELVYPIVAARSSGSRLWDVDGNEYVDALNGFGSNFLGHASTIVNDALRLQLDSGYEIGPMQPVVGDCARLVCELTGHQRAAFCNTGSEAVMGALRIARTVTGRSLVAVFSGSYHGIFDEVIVRGTKRLRSIPAAPGIMPESVENVLVLDYGTAESMEILKQRAPELAGVLVEPVQSRRPDFQPTEFLRELRTVTEQAGCAYIWDEVITGFRVHPGGAQAEFGVKADIATYGKIVGGGLPIGVIAGAERWMDALDGGHWRFGDDSIPGAGVTYFAGTFVRHPLAMAAAKATLEFLKASGPALQRGVNARTERLARELNAHFGQVGAPLTVKHFGSLWKTFFTEDHAMQDLLFCMLRERGVHIWDGFPCFLTAAHSEADVELIISAYKSSIEEMQDAGFFPEVRRKPRTAVAFDAAKPPLPGARLGRDPNGNPAWYVANPENGKYMKVES